MVPRLMVVCPWSCRMRYWTWLIRAASGVSGFRLRRLTVGRGSILSVKVGGTGTSWWCMRGYVMSA